MKTMYYLSEDAEILSVYDICNWLQSAIVRRISHR